jgi:hypothetical protein
VAVKLQRRKPTEKSGGLFFFLTNRWRYVRYCSKLERLKKDSNELKNYLKRVEKEGNAQLAYKLRKKYEYLNTRIEEIHTN